MVPLRLDASITSVVALGAHPDDIEIGAGGLLLSLAEARPGLRVHYALLTGSPVRQAEARAAAERFLPGADITFALGDLPDGRVPGQWALAKQSVHDVASAATPQVVLAPRRDDAHQDHRLLGDFAIQAFRDAMVLHYEIPKWDGDLSRPNLYVPLDDELARRKVDLLDECFPSQRPHDWWDPELFLGLMRVRGMECRARYAEAFDCAKATLTFATAMGG